MTLLHEPHIGLRDGEPMTLEAFERLHNHSGFELIDGIVRERHMAAAEAWTSGKAHQKLANYCDETNAGWAYPKETVYRCFPGENFRKLDGSFIARDRHPAQPYTDRDLDIAPDLAVEVLSPTNTMRDIHQKIRDYFAVGVRRVWMIDPMDRSVRVYSGPMSSKIVFGTDLLEDADLLPGFAVVVDSLFAPLTQATP